MITIKDSQEIEILKEGGKILSQALAEVCKLAENPGISTIKLEQKAQELIRQSGGIPSFENYHGFPNALCVSINQEVVHGIANRGIILESGDIVGIDVGMKYKGLYTDMAYTVAVGDRLDVEAESLRQTTKESLGVGLAVIKSGAHVGDIGAAIEAFVNSQDRRYGIVRQMTGHGVGYKVHEDPMIPNFGKSGKGAELKAGMVLAIEPMLTLGGWPVETLDDGWTTVTSDGSWAAHFEKTVVVTESGYEEITPFYYEK